MSLRIAVAARPYPGESVSGDAVSVDWHGEVCRVAVIDGLGHGLPAETAARTIKAQLAAHPELGAVEMLTRAHDAAAGTRGAAIAVAAIDTAGERLTYAGLGNIDGHLSRDAQLRRLSTDRGILGVTHRRLHPQVEALPASWVLVMHSDGVSARFDLPAVLAETGADPQRLADTLLAGWARATDDATVVVVMPGGHRD